MLFDASDSIQDQMIAPTNWQLLKDFISSLVGSYDPTNTDTRIALVKFSTVTELIHWFSDTQTTQYIQTQLNATQYNEGQTRQLIVALNVVRDRVFNIQFGDRPSIPNVLIVITDGRPTGTTHTELRDAVRSLIAASNVTVIAVGVTSRVDQDTLNILAHTTSPAGITISPITVNDFGQLDSIVGKVVATSCTATLK